MALTFCIIDDEREVCDILRLFFESRGHTCFAAHDGKTGLALIRQHHPAAVFLDVAMPDMNGYEVLIELRKDPVIGKTPIMMMSALTKNTRLSNEEWARSTGADAFLAKPFELEDLLAVVEEITGVKI